MKVALKILLVAAVVVLAYMCYKSITGPIEFNTEKSYATKQLSQD